MRRILFTMLLALALAVPALAVKPDNTGVTKKHNCKKDAAVDQPAEILGVDVIAPNAIRILCSEGYDAGGYVGVNYYTFTNSVNEVNHYSLWTARTQPDFYTNGTEIQGFVPGETYTVTLMSTDPCRNFGYATPYTFTMPGVYYDNYPPVITDVQVTHDYFNVGYHAIKVYADDPSGIRSVEYYFDMMLLYTHDAAANLKPYNPGGTMYVHPYAKEYYGMTGDVVVRVTDNAGNVTARVLRDVEL